MPCDEMNVQKLTVRLSSKASKAAGIARKTMMGAFDDVDTMFTDIELFLQIYPGDENIQKASIDLISSTLFAVENVITFFLKGTCKYRASQLNCQDRYTDINVPQ